MVLCYMYGYVDMNMVQQNFLGHIISKHIADKLEDDTRLPHVNEACKLGDRPIRATGIEIKTLSP